MHSDYGGSFVFGVTGHQKPFLIALRFAARKPAAQGKVFFLPYPAFTSQRVRKTAPTLTRHAGLLSGRPCRGWFLVAWTIDSHF